MPRRNQAAVLASIFLRLAEWHERFRPSDESMQLAEELYARSAIVTIRAQSERIPSQAARNERIQSRAA